MTIKHQHQLIHQFNIYFIIYMQEIKITQEQIKKPLRIKKQNMHQRIKIIINKGNIVLDMN